MVLEGASNVGRGEPDLLVNRRSDKRLVRRMAKPPEDGSGERHAFLIPLIEEGPKD